MDSGNQAGTSEPLARYRASTLRVLAMARLICGSGVPPAAMNRSIVSSINAVRPPWNSTQQKSAMRQIATWLCRSCSSAGRFAAGTGAQPGRGRVACSFTAAPPTAARSLLASAVLRPERRLSLFARRDGHADRGRHWAGLGDTPAAELCTPAARSPPRALRAIRRVALEFQQATSRRHRLEKLDFKNWIASPLGLG